MSKLIKGIVSDGVAIAKAYLIVEPDLSMTVTKSYDIESEVEKFNDAIEASKSN